MSFPKEFLWGVATSAYQIEGAAGEGGKGTSVWDRFSKVPGRIADGSTGERACDHFHLFREDVALMADLGIPCYRFSLSWPRLLPDGRGRLSPDGAAFYDRLIDALLEKGILSKCEYGFKVLGNGKVSKKVTVKASAFSASAKEAIEAAGGKAEVM